MTQVNQVAALKCFTLTGEIKANGLVEIRINGSVSFTARFD